MTPPLVKYYFRVTLICHLTAMTPDALRLLQKSSRPGKPERFEILVLPTTPPSILVFYLAPLPHPISLASSPSSSVSFCSAASEAAFGEAGTSSVFRAERSVRAVGAA
jgi:hypothetical protein